MEETGVSLLESNITGIVRYVVQSHCGTLSSFQTGERTDSALRSILTGYHSCAGSFRLHVIANYFRRLILKSSSIKIAAQVWILLEWR